MAEYDKLLDRALEQIPKAVFEKSRFQIPEADVVIVGNRTILRNFRSIASALNREPEHLIKYLLRELGVAGNLEGNQAVFQGKFVRSAVDDRIKRYVEEFVLCRECGKPDTRIVKRERIQMLKCEACGARASVRSV
ncbi:MAG: translation initiation factor IF-2 subunit beta [Hadesarchaea archaeon DG-33-1]|nr:MAG: translation initiation factor IF-2 subunit beta [Hadesarchaea archaeon DG-33-1]